MNDHGDAQPRLYFTFPVTMHHYFLTGGLLGLANGFCQRCCSAAVMSLPDVWKGYISFPHLCLLSRRILSIINNYLHGSLRGTLHMQGFELADPTKLGGPQPTLERSGTESYFSELSGFRSIKKL